MKALYTYIDIIVIVGRIKKTRKMVCATHLPKLMPYRGQVFQAYTNSMRAQSMPTRSYIYNPKNIFAPNYSGNVNLQFYSRVNRASSKEYGQKTLYSRAPPGVDMKSIMEGISKYLPQDSSSGSDVYMPSFISDDEDLENAIVVSTKAGNVTNTTNAIDNYANSSLYSVSNNPNSKSATKGASYSLKPKATTSTTSTSLSTPSSSTDLFPNQNSQNSTTGDSMYKFAATMNPEQAQKKYSTVSTTYSAASMNGSADNSMERLRRDLTDKIFDELSSIGINEFHRHDKFVAAKHSLEQELGMHSHSIH